MTECLRTLDRLRRRSGLSDGEVTRRRAAFLRLILVEAYSIIRWKAGTFGNVSTHGTVSMFEKEGFRIVAPLSGTNFQTNVLMRRTI